MRWHQYYPDGWFLLIQYEYFQAKVNKLKWLLKIKFFVTRQKKSDFTSSIINGEWLFNAYHRSGLILKYLERIFLFNSLFLLIKIYLSRNLLLFIYWENRRFGILII